MPRVQAEISEGPTWLEAREELAFVDIEGKAVHVWSPRDGSSWKLDVPGRPGTLTPTCQPHLLLIAIEQAIFWLDLDRREVNLSCPPPPPPPGGARVRRPKRRKKPDVRNKGPRQALSKEK